MKDIIWNGAPIAQPGMYRDIPVERYHEQICAAPSVSSSGLRRCLEENGGSPAHFYCEWSGNPNQVEPPDKAHFVIGRALHHLMLGQPLFTKSFLIRPDELTHYKTGELRAWHGNNTECKEWMAHAAASGKTVLTTEMIEHIKGMAIKLGGNPLVRNGILNGKIERSIIWQDKATGLFLKVRPDAIPTDSGDAADLKSCNSVQWIDLMRSITDFAYHQQGALIRTAYREVLKMELSTFSLVFIEKKPPHCVRVVQIKPNDLDLGEKQNRKALDLIAHCIDEKRWPGPGDNDADAPYIDIMEKYRERATEALSAGG